MLVAARCLTTRTKLQLHPWTGNRWAQFSLAALYKMGCVRDIVCIYHYIIIIIILPVQYILRTCNYLAASPQPRRCAQPGVGQADMLMHCIQ